MARKGEMRNVYSITAGKREGKKNLGDLSVGGMIILQLILEK
jgi:hypothetical protein